MPETGEALKRLGARPGRCASHPTEASVAVCDVCDRGLCLSCAIPVRGRVVGAECLPSVVEDPPPQAPPAAVRPPRGDWLALAGFVAVVIATVFPWARSGAGVADGFGEAWTLHWSLLAAVAGLMGVAAVLVSRRMRFAPEPSAGIYAALAAVVILGAILHAARPPVLSNAAATIPWRVAVAGAVVALIGAGRKVFEASRRRRPLTH